MKKILMLAAMAVMGLGIGMQAQDEPRGPGNGPGGKQDGPGGPDGRPAMEAPRANFDPAKRAERMAKDLQLDEKQKTDLTALFKTQNEEMQKMREQQQNATEDNREAFRDQMKKMREQNDQKLEQIIGKEKMAQWKALREERMRQRAPQTQPQ